MESEQRGSRRVRIAYVTMAVVALGLSMVAGDTPFIAMSGLILVVSLLGAFIARKQQRQDG